MSHELKPLNAILSFCGVCAMTLAIGNEKYSEYAKNIYDSGNHLLGLINDVLDMAKLRQPLFKPEQFERRTH